MDPALIGELRNCMPPQAVLDDTLRLALYSYDGALTEGSPDLAILPETTEQTAAAVKLCAEAGAFVIPRGAATSLSGGPVPIRGGVVFAFTRMDRVVELDYTNQRAVVQPGVVNLDFQNILARDGYFYAPDPASQCVCTLGGNVGENSGGPHCLKYGVTANHVMGLEMVLPDGRILRTGGKALDWPGYDLTGIIVGSEGTLGLVTEITCRVMPMPDAVVTMLAVFNSLDEASRSVSDVIAAGIIPATLEMMDNPMIQAVEKHLKAGYPLDAAAVLIVELDGLAASLDRQVRQVEDACRRNGVRSFQVAENEEQRALLWKGRKGAFGAVVNIAPSKICTDISVPRSELPKVLSRVMEISRKWDIPITNVFHAGDGNLHPLVLFDPRDEDQLRRAREADREITRLGVEYGGVLTGEHGIGLGKLDYMPLMFKPAELRLMWRIKDAFDTRGLCNPGKVLPDRDTIPRDESGVHATAQFAALCPPQGRIQPTTEALVGQILTAANREKKKVFLQGAGTKSGGKPDGFTVVDLGRLNEIISYDHENLTITVQCGVTLPMVDEATAAKGQMLALRPRYARQATLGGVVSANDSGPHRLLYGGPRDMLTGVKAALPTGEVVSFGSTCVKNVAGYAVERLLIGSHGSLAAILEMTFRTLPRPEVFRTLRLPVDGVLSAEGFLADLFKSGLRPAAVEMLNPVASHALGVWKSDWQILFALEGSKEEVDESQQRISEMARGHNLGKCAEVEADYADLWARITDLENGHGVHILKLSCPMGATAQLVECMNLLDWHCAMRASPGLGLIHCAVIEEHNHYLRVAHSLASERGGHASWLPPEPEGARAVPEGVALDVCRKVKNAFDPNGVLPE